MPFCIWSSRRGNEHLVKLQSGTTGLIVTKTFAVDATKIVSMDDAVWVAGRQFQQDLLAEGNQHGLYPIITFEMHKYKINKEGYINKGQTYVGGSGLFWQCWANLEPGIHGHLACTYWPTVDWLGYRDIPAAEVRRRIAEDTESRLRYGWLNAAHQAGELE